MAAVKSYRALTMESDVAQNVQDITDEMAKEKNERVTYSQALRSLIDVYRKSQTVTCLESVTESQ